MFFVVIIILWSNVQGNFDAELFSPSFWRDLSQSAKDVEFYYYTIGVAVFFAVVAYFLKFSYEGLREEYALRLTEEKSIVETNKKLATELKALTETRYLEFKARERLGLKKPKEEEVLVVR